MVYMVIIAAALISASKKRVFLKTMPKDRQLSKTFIGYPTGVLSWMCSFDHVPVLKSCKQPRF